MSQPMVCPKCGGTMEIGFLLDRGHYDQRRVSEWVEGEPIKSFWRGGMNLNDKEQYEVETYRCVACGYLESYARLPKDS